MTRYVACINTPGCLPDTDSELPTFDTAREAWSYLADERGRAVDDAVDLGGPNDPTYDELCRWTVAPQDGFPVADWTGSVTGPTPGYDGSHDLGVVYSVEIAEEEEDRAMSTTPRRHRYDQCDATCTVDCGHCKGAGGPR